MTTRDQQPIIYFALKADEAKDLVHGLRYLNDDAPGLVPGASRMAERIKKTLNDAGYNVRGGY